MAEAPSPPLSPTLLPLLTNEEANIVRRVVGAQQAQHIARPSSPTSLEQPEREVRFGRGDQLLIRVPNTPPVGRASTFLCASVLSRWRQEPRPGHGSVAWDELSQIYQQSARPVQSVNPLPRPPLVELPVLGFGRGFGQGRGRGANYIPDLDFDVIPAPSVGRGFGRGLGRGHWMSPSPPPMEDLSLSYPEEYFQNYAANL